MPLPSRRSRRFAPVVAAVLALSACASSSPRTDLAWTAPGVPANSGLLRGAPVLVACEAPDLALRKVCQEQVASELVARGARALPVSDGTADGRVADDQLLPEARAAGAGTILVVSLRPVATETGSGFQLGLGGFGFGRGSALGGGVTVPVGGSRTVTALSASGRVSDVAAARLVWTATVTSPSGGDAVAQIDAVASALLDEAGRSGLI